MSDPLNIIMVLTDQFRGDCIGALGHETVKTPYLDELAYKGTAFTRAYSPSPVCVPARACLVTGKSASNTGFLANNFKETWDYRDTLMEVLRNNGYQTINFGKNHFRPVRTHLGYEINQIYEVHNDDNNIPSDYHLWLEHETGGRVIDTAKANECNGRVVLPWVNEPSYHPTEWTMNEALKQLEKRDLSRPFFLSISFHRPHPPLDPPLYYYEMYKGRRLPEVPVGDWVEDVIGNDDITLLPNPHEGRFESEDLDETRRGYYGAISHIDTQIGKLLIWLKRKKMLKNTMILFTSDHGEMLGDHNMFRKGSAFDGCARVPLIVKMPGAIMTNQRIDAPVSLLDIMPTVLDAANVQCPSGVEGKSLIPALDGKAIEDRKYVFGEVYDAEPNRGWIFVVSDRYKFVWESRTGLEFFFDLSSDPNELRNLIGCTDVKDTIDEMRQYMIDNLSERPSDGLTDGTRLISGKILPSFRKLT